MERSSGAAPPRRSGEGRPPASPDGELLTIEIESVGNAIRVVALAGELDLSTIPRLEDLLFRELRDRGTVVVDLTRLRFIDSSGIGLLIKAHRAADGAGTLHTVVAPGSQVDRVFGITGIGGTLQLFSERDQAVAAAGKPASRKRVRT